jgi:D-lactate dehydrogenase (cytochrome)
VAAAKRVAERIVERALEVGGTCSGEHGVGHGKLRYMQAEHGGLAALQAMHAIKNAMDPHHILNPGKLGSPLSAFAAPDAACN